MNISPKRDEYLARAKPHIYLKSRGVFYGLQIWICASRFYSVEKRGASPLHAYSQFRKAAYS